MNFGGLRIGGVSGIYKEYDFHKGCVPVAVYCACRTQPHPLIDTPVSRCRFFERPPYDNKAMRSVFHYRSFDFFKLGQVTGPMDVFLSHDWPANIANHGNTAVRLLLSCIDVAAVA